MFSFQGKDRPHLAIVGLGSIGCSLLPLVSVQGIGTISLIDGDTIEEGNLPRQPLYGAKDPGRPKVEVARERTAHLHTGRTIETIPHFVDGDSIGTFFEDVDLVADCTDDIHARKLVDATCGQRNIPLVSGAIHGSQAQVITLHVPRANGRPLSLSSFFPRRTGPGQDDCDMRAVPIHVPALVAALMARRIHALLHARPAEQHLMDLIDLETGSWIKIAPPAAPVDDELIA